MNMTKLLSRIRYKTMLSLTLIICILLLTVTGCNKANNAVTEKGAEVSSQKIMPDIFDNEQIKDKLAVYFFSLHGDEHTGESILIKTPEGINILVDSGIPSSGKEIVDYLKKLKVDHIDYAIATHMHVDHIGGFPTIMNEIPVGKMLTSTFTDYKTSTTVNLFNELKIKNIEFNKVKSGDSLELGKDIRIEFLYPFGEIAVPESVTPEKDNDFMNNTSVVFKLTFKNNTFLFTGDVSMDVENLLVETYVEKLKSDFMKIPHHGSASSSTKIFVETVKPKYSTMCIYAFNDFKVYDRYKLYGGTPFVTSLDGTICMTSDGNNIEFTTEKKRNVGLK